MLGMKLKKVVAKWHSGKQHISHLLTHNWERDQEFNKCQQSSLRRLQDQHPTSHTFQNNIRQKY